MFLLLKNQTCTTRVAAGEAIIEERVDFSRQAGSAGSTGNTYGFAFCGESLWVAAEGSSQILELSAQGFTELRRVDLEGQPRFADVAHELLEFLSDSELVIHNAEFDVGFLEHELRLMGHSRPSIADHSMVLDTLTLAREIHPGQRNSLDALCKRYDVDASRRDVHGALIDAELLARVYLAMTGGQTALSLDDDTVREMSVGEEALVRPRRNDLKLVVIPAKKDEEAAHGSILDKMEVSGPCVFRDLPDS